MSQTSWKHLLKLMKITLMSKTIKISKNIHQKSNHDLHQRKVYGITRDFTNVSTYEIIPWTCQIRRCSMKIWSHIYRKLLGDSEHFMWIYIWCSISFTIFFLYVILVFLLWVLIFKSSAHFFVFSFGHQYHRF